MTTVPDATGLPVGGRQRSATRTNAAATTPQLALLARPLASYYMLVGTTLLLLGIGLVMVFSASSINEIASSSNGSSLGLLRKQLVWVGLGLPAMWLASRLPARTFRVLAYPLLILSIVLMVLVMVMGIGEGGAVRWLTIGPITMQPSELAKLALALWGADLFARKPTLLTDWKHVFIPLLPVTTVLVVLVMIQRDMGTTLVVLAILIALLWVVGLPAKQFSVFFTGAVAMCAVFAVSEPYRWARVQTFLKPEDDLLGKGFQAMQGKIGIAQGGWFGFGLGNSRQKWGILPNGETDFIFAIIGEELGLLGTLIVVALFALLGYVGLRIAQRSTDSFSRYAAAAVTIGLLAQAIINMGAVVGLVPITGIPLPLISAGGSALLSTLFALGMLASFARREPGAAEALAARGAGPVAQTLRSAARYYGFGPAPTGTPTPAATLRRRRRRRRRASGQQ